MSVLLEQYSSLSKDQKESLGKVSSRINKPGCHLVEITSMYEIDGSRVKVDFKDDFGATLDYTGFLTRKDKEGNVVPNSNTMNQLTFICNAIDTDLGQVLARGKATTLDFTKGTVDATEFPSVKGKKLYITTTTEVEANDQDSSRPYVKQVIDPRKFFDIKKRNAIEIASKADEGKTMDVTIAEAEGTFNAHYKSKENPDVIAKVMELEEKYQALHNPTAAPVGRIETNTPAPQPAVSADDI